MMTHRAVFDLKLESGSTEARELELVASSTPLARLQAEQMLFRAYRDRARITEFVSYFEETNGRS